MYPLVDVLGTAPNPVPALRHQRTLLAALHDDVQAAWQNLSEEGVTDTWRGTAQQGYLDRLEHLRSESRALARLLEDAVWEATAAIDRAHAGLW